MNAHVQYAWQAGLDVLKPSSRDLEHGLTLHRDALVIESYSLGLRGSIDAKELVRLHAEGAADSEIRETYSQMFLTSMVTDDQLRKEYAQALHFAGVDCLFQNAGQESQVPMQLIKRLAAYTFTADMMGDLIHRAASPADILRAKAAGKPSMVMTTNGIPIAQEWKSVEEELAYLLVFFQLGVRMMHLTYNRRNMLADGCQEATNAGLSDFGQAAIRQMNKVGLIIDVAHTGQQSCIEAAQTSDKPIIASHSGAWSVNPHGRCKTDQTIAAIVDKGGAIGICCIPSFLGGSGDLQAFLDHIDHVAHTFGCDAVTIGTDRQYIPAALAEAEKNMPSLRKARPGFEKLWQPHDHPNHQPGFNDPRMHQSLAWTNWPLFTVGLVQRGYSDKDIQKILGGNMLRIAQANFPANIPTGEALHHPCTFESPNPSMTSPLTPSRTA